MSGFVHPGGVSRELYFRPSSMEGKVKRSANYDGIKVELAVLLSDLVQNTKLGRLSNGIVLTTAANIKNALHHGRPSCVGTPWLRVR